MRMRENAGEISLCGNVREKRAKCGSLPPNAGGLATMRKLPIRFFCKIVDHSEGKNCTWQFPEPNMCLTGPRRT